jgi:hypothetical protein
MEEPRVHGTLTHSETAFSFLVPLSAQGVPAVTRVVGRCFVCNAKITTTNKLGRCTNHQPSLSADTILKAVTKKFKVTVSDLEDPCRESRFVIPRYIAMAILRGDSAALRPYPAIGRLLGNRDHTTVICGIKRIHEIVRKDPELAKTIMELLDELPKLPTLFLGQQVPTELPRLNEDELQITLVPSENSEDQLKSINDLHTTVAEVAD